MKKDIFDVQTYIMDCIHKTPKDFKVHPGDASVVGVMYGDYGCNTVTPHEFTICTLIIQDNSSVYSYGHLTEFIESLSLNLNGLFVSTEVSGNKVRLYIDEDEYNNNFIENDGI